MKLNSITFENLQLITLFQGKRGMVASEMTIDYSPEKYCRKAMPEQYEKEIDKLWAEKTSKNDRIYNAAKFRFYTISQQPSGNLELKVGITDYKDLLGTHYSPNCASIMKLSENAEDPFMHMSNAIGVGALTITSDNWVVLVQRADWTGEWSGKIDRPGGHPEPHLARRKEDLPLNEEKCAAMVDPRDFFHLEPELVLQEIFISPQSELRDEINIPLENQVESNLLGIVRSLEYGGRVGMDFRINLNLTKEQVEERYLVGSQEEADESVKLIWLQLEDVRTWSLDPNLLQKMTPHCKGGLRLLHLIMQV